MNFSHRIKELEQQVWALSREIAGIPVREPKGREGFSGRVELRVGIVSATGTVGAGTDPRTMGQVDVRPYTYIGGTSGLTWQRGTQDEVWLYWGSGAAPAVDKPVAGVYFPEFEAVVITSLWCEDAT